jgi:hypothetical protein
VCALRRREPGVRAVLQQSVMIMCPHAGEPAWTGVTMSETNLRNLDKNAVFAFRCSCCGEQHTWSPADAWLGEND